MSEITETPVIGGEVPASKSSWGRVARWAAVLLVVGLIALLGWGVVQAATGPRDSGMAPDFTITGVDGRTVALSQLRGQGVLGHFGVS